MSSTGTLTGGLAGRWSERRLYATFLANPDAFEAVWRPVSAVVRGSRTRRRRSCQLVRSSTMSKAELLRLDGGDGAISESAYRTCVDPWTKWRRGRTGPGPPLARLPSHRSPSVDAG